LKLSKKANRKKSFLSNSPAYSLIALYMPLAILAALIFLLKAFLPIPVPVNILLICGGLAALTASFYCDFMKDVKSSRTGANVRGGLIVMVIFYAVASLLNFELPWRMRFLPNIANILVSVQTFYIWGSVISLKHIFGARMFFEVYTEKYRGEELQKAIFEDSSLMLYTDRNVVSTRGNYLSQLFFVFIVTFVCVSLNVHISTGIYILLILLLAGGMCISAFFGIMRWEHYYAGEGMAISAADRFKRLLGIGIFTAFCIVIALLLSSDKSLLPFSMIAGFLSWLLGLLRRTILPGVEPPPPEIIDYMLPSMPDIPFQDMLPEETGPWPGLRWIRYGIIAFIGLLFIWFMISPLINRGKDPDKLPFFKRLIHIFSELFYGIVNLFVSLIDFIKDGKSLRKLRKPQDDEIRRASESIFGAYSLAKKGDMKRSVTLFARLIIWGGEVRQVPWKPSHAPAEYCYLLTLSPVAAAVTEDEPDYPALLRQNEKIIRCGEIFEKALYSAEVLSSVERKEFKDLVEEITSTPE